MTCALLSDIHRLRNSMLASEYMVWDQRCGTQPTTGLHDPYPDRVIYAQLTEPLSGRVTYVLLCTALYVQLRICDPHTHSQRLSK